MAEVLQSPPTETKDEKLESDNGRDTLVLALDDLLKRYLLLLDRYTQARRQLASDLSSGYISLAQANFNAPNHIRYGHDYYDERMQASRRVTIDERDSKLSRSISLFEPPSEPCDLPPKHGAKDQEHNPEPESQGSSSPPAKDKDVKKSDAKAEKELEDEASKPASGSKTKSNDPIRWFGILVPPALRAAQDKFIRAVEGPIPQITNLAAELRGLESEIGRARKQIRKSHG